MVRLRVLRFRCFNPPVFPVEMRALSSEVQEEWEGKIRKVRSAGHPVRPMFVVDSRIFRCLTILWARNRERLAQTERKERQVSVAMIRSVHW